MARETIYIVQVFTAGKGTRLNASAPMRCKTSDAALRTAERIVVNPAGNNKVGVVAFSSSGDSDAGDYDDQPAIIFKSGRLPAPFGDA